MALKSELFKGDAKLEAAAVSDPAHIAPGARGDHVAKIQTALIRLDGATIKVDSQYGPATANAVLAYKRKREIVNRTYQSEADNIVGKMTIAAMDEELFNLAPPKPRGKVRLTAPDARKRRHPRPAFLVELLDHGDTMALAAKSSPQDDNGVRTGFAIGDGEPKRRLHFAGDTIVLQPNQRATFEVIDGAPGKVFVDDPLLATVFTGRDPTLPDKVDITIDDETLFVASKSRIGRTRIRAESLGDFSTLELVVTNFVNPPVFKEGVAHNHKPTGRWEEVRQNPNNTPKEEGPTVAKICTACSDFGLVVTMGKAKLTGQQQASAHLDHYLAGSGSDFNEDANIRRWLENDANLRKRLKKEIFPPLGKAVAKGFFRFGQEDFGHEESKNCFGSIDRVDFEVDFFHDSVRVFFKDRYEWHPWYPGIYDEQEGDGRRITNCVHAAMVEMKSRGAADYWMVGQGEISLSRVATS